MRKLLNTLYITKENAFLGLDGENLVLFIDGKENFRIPFTNIESIICFSYLGCSPAVMGKCAKEKVSLSFISPQGIFLASVTGPIKGNVLLRIDQIEVFQSKEKVTIIKNIVSTKIKNSKSLILRSLRDNKSIDDGKITICVNNLQKLLNKLKDNNDIDVIRGIEGQAAKEYFEIFDKLIIANKNDFKMNSRSKRPPLDKVNAILSFLYTICINDIKSALECVGLDPYIGVYHTLRPGRPSLACDIIEEFRAFIDRLVLTMINLKMITNKDFDEQVSGAVFLNNDGRKKVLTIWQNKKKEESIHPIIKEKIQYGLYPYVQATLMAKYIRKEIDEYEGIIWR